MKLSDATDKLLEFTQSSLFVVLVELWPIIKKHKVKTFFVIVFHIWVYGLAFHHIAELKSVWEIFKLF